MDLLKHLHIEGYKSIREADLEFGALNVLVGANGSGKSNLVAFFKLLHCMMNDNLQVHTARCGGASSQLYYGSKTSTHLRATLKFLTDHTEAAYRVHLDHAAPDAFVFAEEFIASNAAGAPAGKWKLLGAGHYETMLGKSAAAADGEAAKIVRRILGQCPVFQFHDTSESANVKQGSYVEDNLCLRSDAGNLAALLYKLEQSEPAFYHRIVETIRQCVPFFSEFLLAPSKLNPRNIILNWRERDSEMVFGPHQLSDGTLRLMALVTLLLQPEKDLPPLIFIDEPELGLHPYAIHLLASLLKSAAESAQVIVATQSVTLLNQFDPEEIIVTERARTDGHFESVFRRYTSEELKEWLDEYSMGELWEKNVIGGRPST